MSEPPGAAHSRRATAILAVAFRFALYGAGVVLFVAIAVALRNGWVVRFDQPIEDAFGRSQASWLTTFARGVTVLGNGDVLAGVAVAATTVLFFLRLRKPALYVALSVGGAGLANHALKLSFARPRPEAVWRLAEAGGYSFPSGHAMVGAALYAALALVFAFRFPRFGGVGLALSLALVGAIGLSRIYLGVHHPSDVIAGWALGGSWALWLRPLLLTPPSAPAPGAPHRRTGGER